LGVIPEAYSIIFFNVDRADQLDCRRWRDNIKKVVRETLRAGFCFVTEKSTTERPSGVNN
jgi:hypothetical protein